MKTAMKIKAVLAVLVAAGASFASTAAQAALLPPVVLGDTGTLRVTTYAPGTSVGTATVLNPYGSPAFPTVTNLPGGNGWVLTFNPSPDFFASANNFGGGKTTEMDGKLDLQLTSTVAFKATVSVYESGIFSKTGNGTVDVSGGFLVSEADHGVPAEQKGGPLAGEIYTPPGGPAPSAGNTAGTWKSETLQIGGFAGNYFSYKISLDNTLLAEALGSQTPGTASIAKKLFSIVITTDGSSGQPNTPEPASLGVLAIGSLALLARRRKA